MWWPGALLKGVLAGSLLATGSTEAGQGGNSQGGNNQDGNSQGGSRGAPGPIAGAGLPFIAAGAIFGGMYWLIRRRINRANEMRD